MPSSGHRKVLNAASIRSGLAIHTMSTASRGKTPAKSANRQPIASSSLGGTDHAVARRVTDGATSDRHLLPRRRQPTANLKIL